MIFRPYNPATDRQAAHRILREVGWEDHTPEHEEASDLSLTAGQTMAAELDGAVECVVAIAPATVRYLGEDLPMAALTAVVTSHVARKQGLAARLGALSLARQAADGALVAGLGMFEQGYYDHLGFGTGSYDHQFAFDPAQLTVRTRPRVPRRLTAAEAEAVHAARLSRPRGHGAFSLTPPALTRGEMLTARNPIGLGYCDGPGGALSHYIWCSTPNMEHGPYILRWLAYQTGEQFLELMALLRSLSDQVRLVVMLEPPGIQLQTLLTWPFKQLQVTEKSPFAAAMRFRAWWQMRICDLPGCLARTHLPAGTARFNLRLTDPIAAYLPPSAPWHGVAGEYVVTLGPSSGAAPGVDPALPTLAATVNAFTRLWLGVGPATGLAVTDDLAGPPELLEQLEAVLCLPRPQPGWEF